jgi:putative membrane protein
MTAGPDGGVMMALQGAFALVTLGYVWWRFGGGDAATFGLVAGGYSAAGDVFNAFAKHAYEYPGHGFAWVFVYVFLGWIGISGTCLFVAEGILARAGHDLLTQRHLGWQAPLLAGLIAVAFDLFVDPVAASARFWVWLVPGPVFYGIPLLNFVGWFVLVLLAAAVWTWIVKHRPWAVRRKLAVAAGAWLPCTAAGFAVSAGLNRAIGLLGLQ